MKTEKQMSICAKYLYSLSLASDTDSFKSSAGMKILMEAVKGFRVNQRKWILGRERFSWEQASWGHGTGLHSRAPSKLSRTIHRLMVGLLRINNEF